MKNSISARFNNILPRIKNPQPILSHTKFLLPIASETFPFKPQHVICLCRKQQVKLKKIPGMKFIKKCKDAYENGDEGKLHDA